MTPSASGLWVDIVPPAAPVQPVSAGVVAAAVALLLALAALALLYLRSPRRRARRALRSLARDLRRSRVAARPACHRVADCLRTAFGCRRLQCVPWDASRGAAWRAYVNALGRCRFAAEPPTAPELAAILGEALDWLEGKRVER